LKEVGSPYLEEREDGTRMLLISVEVTGSLESSLMHWRRESFRLFYKGEHYTMIVGSWTFWSRSHLLSMLTIGVFM